MHYRRMASDSGWLCFLLQASGLTIMLCWISHLWKMDASILELVILTKPSKQQILTAVYGITLIGFSSLSYLTIYCDRMQFAMKPRQQSAKGNVNVWIRQRVTLDESQSISQCQLLLRSSKTKSFCAACFSARKFSNPRPEIYFTFLSAKKKKTKKKYNLVRW